MTDIRTSLPIPTQPWEAARERLYEGLLPHERSLYSSATLENLFYDASSSQQSHARGSRIWRLQERLAPLVESLEEYGKAMDVFVNTYPLILSPLWGSLRLVLLIAAEAAKFQESLVDMLAQIGDVLPRFRIYERLFKNHERLLVALSAGYLDILRFCIASKDLFVKARKSKISLSIVLRSMWKSHLREFDTYMSKFRAHSKHVEKEAGLAHMIESARIRDIETQNRALQLRNANFEKRNRVLASLPAVNYINKQSKLSSSKHPGTCEWPISTPEVEAWYAQPLSSCICCYGIPGSGKSVLAASIRDFLVDKTSNTNTEKVCFYYCDYSDKPSLSMTHVMGSLIKQVLEHLDVDQFGENFECPYEASRDFPTHDEGIRYLLDLLSRYSITYMILDGIDELDAPNQTQVLALIDCLIRRTLRTIKIFVTSRTEEFRVKESLKLYPAIHLSSELVDNDIAAFVKDEINQIRAPHPLAFDHELRDEVTQVLVEGAKGMFLWAKFQLLDVEEAFTTSALRTILENLPKNLSDTYLRIIRRTSQSVRGQAKLDTMQRVFRWVAVARRPLKIHELEEAIALESTDTYLHFDRLPRNAGAKLVSDCSNLVVLNDGDNTVGFAHHTVKQFLFSSRNCGAELLGLTDLDSSDAEVGEICLAYLNFSDFETQLAKAPTQSHVEVKAPLAEGIVWSSVPFGGQVRDLLARNTPWRAKAVSPKESPLKFAVPVRLCPTVNLHQKYTLLEYIIEHWVYHTSSLGPHSAVWPRFRHLALYRQMDFEFRPWNESFHERRVEAITEVSKKTWERLHQRRKLSTSMDEYPTQLSIYAWAMEHNVRSLFEMLDRDVLGLCFYMVRAEIFPDTLDLDVAWKTRYDDLEVILAARQTPNGPSESLNTSRQYALGWSGTFVVRLLQVAFIRSIEKPLRDERFSYFDEFIKVEITRWAGLNTWTELIVEAAVCAMQCNDRIVFEGVWKRCVDDTSLYKPLGLDWPKSTSFKAIEALLCVSASHLTSTHLEWDVVFFSKAYLSPEQLRWTIKHSAACKTNSRISQSLFVAALASKKPFREMVNLWTRLGLNSQTVRRFDPMGSWKASFFASPSSFSAIEPFIKVNIPALMEELSSVSARLTHYWLSGNRSTAYKDFVKIIYSIVKIWDKYRHCFSIDIFENDGIKLLEWTIAHDDTAAARALVSLYRDYLKEDDDKHTLPSLRAKYPRASREMLLILLSIHSPPKYTLDADD